MREAINAFRDRGEEEFAFTRLFHEGGLPPYIPEAAVRFVLESMECAEEENALMFRDEHIHLI